MSRTRAPAAPTDGHSPKRLAPPTDGHASEPAPPTDGHASEPAPPTDGHVPPQRPTTARHTEAIDRLLTAASGLAATMAITEELTQQRADLLRRRVDQPRLALTPRRPSIVSLAEAARRTGRHPEVLRRWCSEGRIPAVRIGRTWGITTDTLATLMAHAARSRPRLPSPSEPA